MLLTEFLERLQKVKKSGGSYTAQCPGHEDRVSSLSISQGEDGRILLKCHAGCDVKHICESMGLTMKDLFPDNQPSRRKGTSSSRIKAEYNYTDADGTLLYQVVRFCPKDFKQRRPDPDNPGQWLWNMTSVERVLYNLPAVVEAIQRGKKVFVVEGEKDVETLRQLGLTATTSVGGAAKRWSSSYSAVLNKTTCLVIPDNDEAGRKHALAVRHALKDAVILQLPGLPEHGDVTDWVQAGGDRETLITLARQALEDRNAEPPPREASDEPFRLLGHNRGRYYFWPNTSQQVVVATASSLKNSVAFYELAPKEYWESRYMGDRGCDYKAAANDLIQQCHKKGLYNAAQRRGRGAWLDDGRIVLNQGNHLIVDGQPTSFQSFESRYVYELSLPMHIPHAHPIDTLQGMQLVEIANSLCWRHRIAAQLFAGWIALAPICGVLRWRPHIWVTGPAGSGKSWVLENIVSLILGDVALRVQSVSTEAGIRQALGQDARPVLFDEAELEDEHSQTNMLKVLELARQASSEDGGNITKGSATGQVQVYQIRSMFCLSSVGLALRRHADETRVTVLSLELPPGGEEGAEQFAKLSAGVEEVCTRDFCAGLVARSCRLATVIRENAETFAVAVSQQQSSRRIGDQIGTLLAGYWSLWSDARVSLQEAIDYVSKLTLGETEVLPDMEQSDEMACLNHILQSRLRVENQNRIVERNVAELIEAASGKGTQAGIVEADNALQRFGLRVIPEGLVVATNHSGLRELLRGTPWKQKWYVFLKRCPGVETMKSVKRFAGSVSKAILIPWDLIDSQPENSEVEVKHEHDESLPF